MEVNAAVSALREALGAQVVALPDEFGDRRTEDWSGLPSAVPLALISHATPARSRRHSRFAPATHNLSSRKAA